MNQTQVNLYHMISRHDKATAEKYVGWCNQMAELAKQQAAPDNETRGGVLARLQEILASADGVLVNYGDMEARHVFLWAISRSPSTTDLTLAQCRWLLSESATKANDGWLVDPDTANSWYTATSALIKEGAHEILLKGEKDMPNGPQPNPGPGKPQAQGPGPQGPQAPGPQTTGPSPSEPHIEPEPAEAPDATSVTEAQWHSEAPVSTTIKAYRNGFDAMVTLRAGVDGEMLRSFIHIVNATIGYLEQQGFTPRPHGTIGTPAGSPGTDAPSGGQPAQGILDSGTSQIEFWQVAPDDGAVSFHLLTNSTRCTTTEGLRSSPDCATLRPT